MNLIERCRAWRTRRYWQKRQLEHLRILILSDWRWLAHDPVANALTTRYKRALSESWYKLAHEDSGTLRERLGLAVQPSKAPIPGETPKACRNCAGSGVNPKALILPEPPDVKCIECNGTGKARA